jgi:hypothetical protein
MTQEIPRWAVKPHWAKEAIPTELGWVNPNTREMYKSIKGLMEFYPTEIIEESIVEVIQEEEINIESTEDTKEETSSEESVIEEKPVEIETPKEPVEVKKSRVKKSK